MGSKQTIVEPNKTEPGLGEIAGYSTANSELLSKAFAGSPIIGTQTLTDASVTAEYQAVLDKPINDGGHYFGEYNPTFPDAPNFEDVETGGGGLPATPFVPNVASPGVGSTNPSDLPDAPNTGQTATNNTFGSGEGTINPSKTAKEIAKTKLGDYIMSANPGRSQYTGD